MKSRPAQIASRIPTALTHYRACLLCEHRCAVDRVAGPHGLCHAPAGARVFRHGVEYGEEVDLVPSHVFYLSGCDLRCAFCIAELDAFDPARGHPLTPEWFRQALAWGQARGARNVQWSGGQPSLFLPSILEAMAACPELPPIVWKSNFHETPETLALLDGVVDVFVADLKFGNDGCAARIAGVQGYLATVTRNLQIASRQARLIVRHLLLPGHEDCCLKPILRWLGDNLPDAELSLRDGYLPAWRADHFAELGSPVPRAMAGSAAVLARSFGLRVIQ